MKAIKRKLFLLLPITLLASACTNNPLKKPIDEQETEPTPTSESTASTDLSNILQLLQDGHFQQARSELRAANCKPICDLILAVRLLAACCNN